MQDVYFIDETGFHPDTDLRAIGRSYSSERIPIVTFKNFGCKNGLFLVLWAWCIHTYIHAYIHTRKEHEKNWKGKVTHGYFAKKLEEDETVDISKTSKWMNLRLTTAHIEGFITAAQEQELNTKETQKRREKDPEKENNGYKM